jgi:hypothetical protein
MFGHIIHATQVQEERNRFREYVRLSVRHKFSLTFLPALDEHEYQAGGDEETNHVW